LTLGESIIIISGVLVLPLLLTNFPYQSGQPLFPEALASLQNGLTPKPQILVDVSLVGTIAGQQAPRTTAFEDVENSTKHLLEVDHTRSSRLPKRFHLGKNFLPWFTTDVTRIRFSQVPGPFW
jgi:hypothetical protein